jgi:TonB family protein
MKPHACIPLVLLALGAPRLAAGSSIDKAAVAAEIARARPAIRACYDAELAVRHDARGNIVVEFTVVKEGTVGEALLRSSTIGSKSLEECVLVIVRSLRFPPLSPVTTEPVRISYPFAFEPSVPGAPAPVAPTVVTAPRPLATPHVLATCTRADSWRAGVTMSIEVPDTPAGRKAFKTLCTSRLDAVRRCYEAIPRHDDDLDEASGRADVDLALSRTGKVIGVAVVVSPLGADARACIVDAFSGLVLPRGKSDPDTAGASVELRPVLALTPMGHGPPH